VQQPTFLSEVSRVVFITLNECHFLHYTVWYFGVILLKSQLGDTQAISSSYPSTVYLMSENVCILGKAGVSQDQHSHNPICPMRYAHVVLPNMAWSLVLTPALYYTSQSRRIISRLILQQNRSEIKNYYFNASFCLKSCFTESIMMFWENSMFMMNHQEQKWQWGTTEIVQILAHHVHCTVKQWFSHKILFP